MSLNHYMTYLEEWERFNRTSELNEELKFLVDASPTLIILLSPFFIVIKNLAKSTSVFNISKFIN